MSNTKKMKVLFASAEAAPFVKTGGLGDVAGSLPASLNEAGAETIVMVPLYSTIPARFKDQMEFITSFYVSLGWRNEYCGLKRLVHNGVTYLFVDNERYFGRDYPYGFFDDGERFAFFSKAITESIQYLPDGFTPDILHCNDWHTALAPVFLREFYQGMPTYENIKTVFSIHNIAFQGQFSAKVLEDICGLAHIPAAAFQLTCGPDAVNYMQGALNYTDAITTVSPTYAGEIQSPAYGEHLDGVLRRRRESLQGIVNGIDVDHFNPETDPAIAHNFSVSDRSGKAACKAALQEELGLTVRTDQPLMSMVTRLTRQKGMDLVTYSLDRILSNGVQVAVLGTGDQEYENALRYFASKYPGQMAARIQFDPALSQRMYAGSDLFLMPSLFEPCGLSQMIAMRYGTLPVVRETGGLKDTVIPYNYETGEGTGFSFANFNGDEMGDAVFRGARLFWDNHDAWENVVTQAMQQDFSWTRSAAKYMDLYYWLRPDIPHWIPEAEAPGKPEEPVADESGESPTPKKAPAKKATARKTATKRASTTAKRAAKATATKSEPAKQDEAAADTETKPATKPAVKRAARKTAAAKKAEAAPVQVELDLDAVESPDAKEVKPAPKRTATRKAAAAKKTSASTAKSTPATSPDAAVEQAPIATASAAKTPARKTTATASAAKTPARKTTATASAAKATATKAPARTTTAKAKPEKTESAEIEAEPASAAAKPAAKAPAAKTAPKKSGAAKRATVESPATVKTATTAPAPATKAAPKAAAPKAAVPKAAAPKAPAAKAAAEKTESVKPAASKGVKAETKSAAASKASNATSTVTTETATVKPETASDAEAPTAKAKPTAKKVPAARKTTKRR